MNDRTTRWDFLWLAVVALCVQAFWAGRITHPTYFDAYYYTINAQQLADGKGFTEPIIWQYLSAPEGVPAPAFTYWMPLTSLVAAAGLTLVHTFRGAQLPFWLMAGLLPWLSYAICWQLTRQRTQARMAALMTAAGGYYAAYWVQPTTFVLFAWVAGGCLLVLGWAVERKTAVSWFIAGLLAGLSHLTRTDGILLLGIGYWVLGIGYWKKISNLQSLVSHALTLSAGYLFIMGGWFWRMSQTIGQPLPTGSAETIFLTSYEDIFAFGRSFTLSNYLAWGWANIWQSKLQAVGLALLTLVLVSGLTIFTLFFIWAWVKLGRSGQAKGFLRPFTLYTLLLYGSMSLIFTFPGQRGSLLHASAALWPWTMALAAVGVHLAIEWMGQKRPSWQPERAKRFFVPVFVGLVYVISFVVSLGQPLLREEAAVFQQIQAIVPDDATVMIVVPANFYYQTGLTAIVLPNEPPEVVREVAARYGADYLVLSPNAFAPMRGIYEGSDTHPQIQLVQEFPLSLKLYQFLSSR